MTNNQIPNPKAEKKYNDYSSQLKKEIFICDSFCNSVIGIFNVLCLITVM